MKLFWRSLLIAVSILALYQSTIINKPTLQDRIVEQFELIDTINKDMSKSIVKVSNIAIDMAYLNLAFTEEINKLSITSDKKNVAKEKLNSLMLLDDLNDKALRE